MGKKIANCIRERSNWAKLQEAHKLDSPKFNPDQIKADIQESSPKLYALIQNILDLDRHDMAKHGHTFKHFIYSDIKSGYGAKIIASALVAFGFHHAYGLGKGARGKTFILSAPKTDAFAMLTTVQFFQKPLGIQFRKEILKRFNRRPENVHGEELRIVLLDSGLREGVDLFDVKYVHLFEPILTMGDQKQAVGRATRFCGQKGLTFDNGWPLQVYRYDTEGLFELFLEHSDIDPKKLQLAHELDSVVIDAAVDAELTRAIHGGVLPPHDENVSGGGASGSASLRSKTASPPHDENVSGGGASGSASLRSKTASPPHDEGIFGGVSGGGHFDAKNPSAKDLAAKRVADARRAAAERARMPFQEKRQREQAESIKRYQEHLRELHLKRQQEEREARQKALEDELRKQSAERKRKQEELRKIEEALLKEQQEAEARLRKASAEAKLREAQAKAEAKLREAEAKLREAQAEAEAKLREAEAKLREASAERKRLARKKDVKRIVREAILNEANIRKQIAEAEAKLREAQAEAEAKLREDRLRQAEAEAQAKLREAQLFARKKEIKALIREAILQEAKLRKEAQAQQREWFIRFGQRAPPPGFPTTLDKMRDYVREEFTDCVWPPVEMKNGCEAAGIQGSLEFSPTQNFIRHFLTPKSPHHGLLAYHSVGTGKTCLAIATATTHFEPEGWTILYTTKTTLKGDVWKNMFGQVCSLVLQEKIQNGLQLPTDKAAQTRLLSKSWSVLPPLSYRQFSNVLKGKGQLAAKLRAANGTRDPLHKTLIIIDEAHKLFAADTPPNEKCDVKAIQKALHHSYHVSQQDAAKLLLMTGTPYTDDPMAMIQLMNLLLEPTQKLPESFEDFAKAYLDTDGHFTSSGREQFQNHIAGLVSYLNRENDRRTFSYPIFHDWKIPLSPESQAHGNLQADAAAHQKELSALKKTMDALESEWVESIQAAEAELKSCQETLPAVLKCKKDAEKRFLKPLADAAKICDLETHRQLTEERNAALLACMDIGRDTCDPLKAELKLLKENTKTRRGLLQEQWKSMQKKDKDIQKALTAKKKNARGQAAAIEECLAEAKPKPEKAKKEKKVSKKEII